MTPSLDDRYLGCLVGLAAGDALGAPLAYMGPEQIQIKHGTVADMIGGGWLGLRPGETTDETALVRVLGESLAERGALDRADVAAHYRAWLRTAPKDVGPITRTALEALDEGYGPDEAASRARELTTDRPAGPGTLVRAVPVALAFRADPGRAIRAAAEEAAITHADPLCAGGSAAVAATLVRILGGEEDRAAVLDRAFEDLERHGVGVPNVLPDPTGKQVGALRPGRHVLDALEAAIVVWYRMPDLERGVVAAVNLGGPADAVGALVGALAGATWGVDAVPARWAHALRERRTLAGLARSLLERSEGVSR